jgi:hypothetical protein
MAEIRRECNYLFNDFVKKTLIFLVGSCYHTETCAFCEQYSELFEQRDYRNSEMLNFNSIKQKDVGGVLKKLLSDA